MFRTTLAVLCDHTNSISAPETPFLLLDPDFHGFTPFAGGTDAGDAKFPLYTPVVCEQGAESLQRRR